MFESSIVMVFISLAFISFFLWLVRVFLKRRRRKRFDLSKISIQDVDKMEGYEFEDYLYVLFRSIGYGHTYQTKKSRDYGADLLFVDSADRKTVVQAKRYSDKLGLSAVQEVYTACTFYEAERAIILTSAPSISDPCLKLAAAAKVRIIVRDELEEIIRYFKKGNFDNVQDMIESPFDEVDYIATDCLEQPVEKRGVIQAGDYFYKGETRAK